MIASFPDLCVLFTLRPVQRTNNNFSHHNGLVVVQIRVHVAALNLNE